MKFKIIMNPITGRWEVFLKHKIFGKWDRINTLLQAPQDFKTYDEVVTFIKERGIDKVYALHKSIFHYYPPVYQETYQSNDKQSGEPTVT